jgi:HTH-like domain
VKTETRLSVVRMCAAAGFSRAGYYRFLDPEKPAPADMDLRDEMQKIALEWPSYGSRRITQELKARGWEVNRERVQRLMREGGALWALLRVVKRKFVVTTHSAHGLKVYPNRGGRDSAHRRRSALGSGYHVHSAGRGVRLPGGDSGCVLAARDRMAPG